MKALADAERALAADDEQAVLDALLVAWRATRAPVIAELVETVGQRLEDGIEGPFTGTRAEHHDVWMGICAQRRAVDWPLLVRSIVLTADRFGVEVVKALIERVQAIGDWAPDPRTTSLVVEHLRRPGYESSSSSTYPFWSALCDLLVAHGDPRAAELLAPLNYAQLLRVYSDRKKARVWFQAKADETVARLRALPSPTPLDKAQLAACKKLASALARRGRISEAQRARMARAPIAPKPKPAAKRAARSEHDRAAMDKHLKAAEQAVLAGDEVRALDATIAAWRASRSTKIAELVELVGKRLVGQGAELGTGKRAEMQAAWLAVAKKRRAVDLPALLAHLSNTHGRSTDALTRVTTLAKWPADPRTGVLAVRQLQVLPFDSSSTKPFWMALFALLIDVGDARTLAALEALRGTFARRMKQAWRETDRIAQWFEGQVEVACTTLRNKPAALEPDQAIIDRIAGALGTSTVDKLYAEVLANPDDDGPRAVLGDVLLQKGDPRGELIALQLSGKQPERVAKLISVHARTWLGAVAEHASIGHCTFERGFPAAIMLATNANDADALAGDPVWATVEHLYLGDMGRLPMALLRDAKRIAVLSGLSKKLWNQLLEWPTIPYRGLGTTFAWSARDIEAFGAAKKKLAPLRSLELLDQDRRDWLWSGWLADQLEEVRFDDVPNWGALLGHLHGVKTPRVIVREGSASFEIEPGPPGELVASMQLPIATVHDLLSLLGTGTLTRLRIARPSDKVFRRRIEDHAKRIGFALEYL